MEPWVTGITAPVALASVALLGYMAGRGKPNSRVGRLVLEKKLFRVRRVTTELEEISARLRKNLAVHHSQVNRCRVALRSITDRRDESPIQPSHSELNRLLAPTDAISREIEVAYDALRQHSDSLTRLHS